jgi:ribosomal RNA-processing protein 9
VSVFFVVLFSLIDILQDAVNSLDCWTKERPLSSSSDRSVRMWKVADDSHLVFRGHKASIDNVQYLTPESYISSGQDGSLCVWKETQKKPVVHRNCAHGCEPGSRDGRWISAMASSKMTDFVATGSHDGYLKLWHANAEDRVLNNTASIAVDGFVNSIALSKRIIVAGVGNEHRLGRWWRLNKVKNCLKVFKLPDYDVYQSNTDENSASSSEFDEDSVDGDDEVEGSDDSRDE